MRELTKSMFGLSWALSMRGAQQMLDLLEGEDRDEAEDEGVKSALDQASRTTTEGLDESLKRFFEAGDRVQRGMVDMAWELFSSDLVDPRELAKSSARVLERCATGLKDLVDDVVGEKKSDEGDDAGEETASA